MPGLELPASLEKHSRKIMTAQAAVKLLSPGQHVFVGTACATPVSLVQALEALPTPIPDLELVHFLTTGAVVHDADGHPLTKYRHRSFFAGSDIRAAIREGQAEYVPLSIARVPDLIKLGRIRVDVAMIQVSSPDEFGFVSLGVSVDIGMAAVAKAGLVIAEVNPHMPWTMGESTIHLDQIHALVPVNTPVQEYHHRPADQEVVERIASYIAGIIEDGSTMQIGIGRIPAQALKYLEDRKDLGIHSAVITDAIIPLLEKGIVTGRRKTLRQGKVEASYVLGSRRLFDLLNRNPLFYLQPIELLCHPAALADQPKLVAVTQAFAVDLTGQVCSDQFEGQFYSGLEVQPEFLQGASRSPGGKPIVCLTSTTDEGSSRIRPQLLTGEGVSVARTDVHYVITEFGIAYLFGKSVRERSIALIQIAHPSFRAELMEEAKRLGYLPVDQRLENLGDYPVEEERTVTLKNGKTVLIRPARPSDGEKVRDLFHKLTPDDQYTRFFHRVHGLSSREVQRLCNLNYETEVAFVAVHGPREYNMIVGQSCYFVNLSTNLAETAFMVDPDWQGSGLGTALQLRMAEHARARGLRGFEAEVLPQNDRMVALARKASNMVSVTREEDSLHMTMLF